MCSVNLADKKWIYSESSWQGCSVLWRLMHKWSVINGQKVLSGTSSRLAHSNTSRWKSFQRWLKNSSRPSKVAQWLWPAARPYVFLDSHAQKNLRHLSPSRLSPGQQHILLPLSHTNSKYWMFAALDSQGSDARCISVWRKKHFLPPTNWCLCLNSLSGTWCELFSLCAALNPGVGDAFPQGSLEQRKASELESENFLVIVWTIQETCKHSHTPTATHTCARILWGGFMYKQYKNSE